MTTLVSTTRSGWAWLCWDCGEGGIAGDWVPATVKKKGEKSEFLQRVAERAARDHVCPSA